MLPLDGFSAFEIIHGAILSIVLVTAAAWCAAVFLILFLTIRDELRKKGK
jgi:hypothetical protein